MRHRVVAQPPANAAAPTRAAASSSEGRAGAPASTSPRRSAHGLAGRVCSRCSLRRDDALGRTRPPASLATRRDAAAALQLAARREAVAEAPALMRRATAAAFARDAVDRRERRGLPERMRSAARRATRPRARSVRAPRTCRRARAPVVHRQLPRAITAVLVPSARAASPMRPTGAVREVDRVVLDEHDGRVALRDDLGARRAPTRARTRARRPRRGRNCSFLYVPP